MNKRILSLVLALTLLLTFAAPAALAETQSAWVKMSSSDGTLRLRQGPGTNYQFDGYVKSGDAITVYVGETSYDASGAEWTHIQVNATGKTGYIKTRYISYASSSDAALYIGKNGGTMNVRKGPGTNYAVAGYAKHGDALEIIERGDVWSKIRVSRTGKVGYVKNIYIKSGSSNSSAVSPTSYDVARVATKTAGGTVNVRSGAGTGYSVVAKLGRNAALRVIDASSSWYKVVTANGKTGYIAKNYVSFGASGKTTASVNFRAGAGVGYAALKTLSKGTSVIVQRVEGNWAKVSHNNAEGWISTRYLSW